MCVCVSVSVCACECVCMFWCVCVSVCQAVPQVDRFYGEVLFFFTVEVASFTALHEFKTMSFAVCNWRVSDSEDHKFGRPLSLVKKTFYTTNDHVIPLAQIEAPVYFVPYHRRGLDVFIQFPNF